MKYLKVYLALLITVIMTAALAVPAFALPYNNDIPDNYSYLQDGQDTHAPDAYRVVAVKTGVELSVGNEFNPIDMCVSGDYLYILDKAGCRVLIVNQDLRTTSVITKIADTEEYTVPDLDIRNYAGGKDENGEYPEDAKLRKADKYSFNNPNGIYVDDEGLIYVADTDNRRIVVCDAEGNCKRIYQSVRVSVLGDFNFRPMKVLVDNTGFINVIAYDVNKGLMRIDTDGTFDSFFAQPGVKATSRDLIGEFADSLSGLTDNEIKESAYDYVSATRDSAGFVYVTAYKNEDNAAIPLQKLNSAGENVLLRTDAYDPEIFGDNLLFEEPKMIDVAINEDADVYTLLDLTTARFFTYSGSGALLFVGGGLGAQYGKLLAPTSIVCWGDRIIVGDSSADSITVYEMTDYAKSLARAMALYKARNYDAAAEQWKSVSQYNSNMYLAFRSLGNIALIKGRDLDDGDPEKVRYFRSALSYFTYAGDMAGYSDAYGELRDVQMSKYFNLLFGTVIAVGVGIFVLVQVRKAKRNKEERKRRAGG